MILLWGIPGDEPLDVVAAHLASRDVEVAAVDQRDVRAVQVEVDPVSGAVAGLLTTDATEIALADVGSAYVRPHESTAGTQHADAALVAWADVTAAAVVNRPEAMASNNAKPFQLALLRRCGFDVPATLVTTDPQAVRDFAARHGSVVYKSVSGVRSIVSRLRPGVDIDDVANCPTQFQEYIAGDDVRVHVVGDDLYATAVRSQADDYRYAGPDQPVEVVAIELPPPVADLCRRAARFLGLLVAGLDLRRTAEGSWYAFEANPSPAFTYYEQATGQPLGQAIADLLVRSEADVARGAA